MFKYLTILGFGKSAISTIEFFLANYPATCIRVSELKSRDKLQEAEITALEARGVEFELGQQSKSFITWNGASELFIMVSPGIPPKAPVMDMVRISGASFGTDLDLLLMVSSARKIAITGTNGKTTTTALVAHILETEGLGNIGKPFLEFPEVPNQDVLVLELSSFQLFYSNILDDDKYLPDLSVYLNLTDDHLDWHSSLEEYRNAKAKIFKDVSGKTLVMNYDDPIVRELAVDKSNVRFFSTELETNPGAYYKDEILYLNGEKLINVTELNLVGKHNYSNILAAVLTSSSVGVSNKQIIEKLKTFKPVPHRLEYVATIDGHKFYNDSKATNPDSAIKALEAFDKSIAIVGGKNKNLDMNSFIDKLIEKCQGVVAIGELKSSISDALKAKDFAMVKEAASLNEAVDLACEYAKNIPNIPVVLAPASSSFDMFTGYEDRGNQFIKLVYTKASESVPTS